MAISRELGVGNDKSSLQRDGSPKYISEANYIEFAGVKVCEVLCIVYLVFVPFLCFYVLIVIVYFQIVTPSDNVLVDKLTLRVESGSNLLITGSLFNLRAYLFGVIALIFSLLCAFLHFEHYSTLVFFLSMLFTFFKKKENYVRS